MRCGRWGVSPVRRKTQDKGTRIENSPVVQGYCPRVCYADMNAFSVRDDDLGGQQNTVQRLTPQTRSEGAEFASQTWTQMRPPLEEARTLCVCSKHESEAFQSSYDDLSLSGTVAL